MPVKTGSTVLTEDGFSILVGKRVGFVGNHTSLLADGAPTVHSMIESGINVCRLFSPEHGAFGKYDDLVPNEPDPTTGLPIVSLYGDTKKPTHEMLDDIDVLVLELQDVGARFYTYSSTLVLCIDAVYEAGKKIIVLDRPNPINGAQCEGPLATIISFTAAHTIPIRHGLTLGELALLYSAETGKSKSVQVVSCSGWNRNQWFDQTGCTWISPSPAMQALSTATVYPGVCLLEQTNISVGRGTSSPFELVGAPWVNSRQWADAINSYQPSSVVVSAISFIPTASKFADERCHGISITVTNRDCFRSVDFGFLLLITLKQFFAVKHEITGVQTLLANNEILQKILSGAEYGEIVRDFAAGEREWYSRRRPYLLYS